MLATSYVFFGRSPVHCLRRNVRVDSLLQDASKRHYISAPPDLPIFRSSCEKIWGRNSDLVVQAARGLIRFRLSISTSVVRFKPSKLAACFLFHLVRSSAWRIS